MNIKLLSVVLSLFIFTACGDKELDESAFAVSKSENILTTIDGSSITINRVGNTVTSKEYEGKVVLLDFFATWCPPCKATIPHLIDLQKKYKDDLVVVGVLLEQNKDNKSVADFILDFGINYQVTNSIENFKLSNELGGVQSIPTMFMYAPNGKLVNMYKGAVPQEMIESDIKRALSK